MAKNSKGGSRHKRNKKGQAMQTEKVVLCDVDEGECYAYVKLAYGNGQFGVLLVCSDGDQVLTLSTKEYRGRVSGRMRKQKWRNFVRVGNLVLISKRDFQTNDDKVDIIHVYKDDAVRKLVKMGEVPAVEDLNGENGVTLADTVVFGDDVEDVAADGHVFHEESADGADGADGGSGGSGAASGGWGIDVADI